MSDVHEKPGVGTEAQPLSEAEFVSRFGILHADNTFFAHLKSHKLLTDEQGHEWRQTRGQLADLAAVTIPRILSGELEGIGLEYTPGARVFYITLFEGEHRVPVGINRQIRELLPVE